MKKYLSAIAIMLLMLSGCNGTEKSDDSGGFDASDISSLENESSASSESESDVARETTYSIDISDIDWYVESADFDGTSALSLCYTNNTNYTIAELDIKFTQRSDVTDEERTAFDSWKEIYSDWTDEDMAEIYISGHNRKIADPGETVKDSPCTIKNFYPYVTSMEQYELTEPSEATIVIIGDDEKLHALYYDFSDETCTESSYGSIDAYAWSESELAEILPEPKEARLLKIIYDTDEKLSFDSYGVSDEIFQNYISECKTAGFVNDISEHDTYFRAYNDSDYEVYISYDSIDEEMSGHIEAPSDDEE